MRRRIFAAFAAMVAWLLVAGRSVAAIGAVELGQISTSAGLSASATLFVVTPIPAGSVLWLSYVSTGGDAFSGVSDTAGNSWTPVPGGAYSVVTSPLLSGASVSVTWTTNSGRKFVSGWVLTGVDTASPVGWVGVEATAASTTPSITTGTLSVGSKVMVGTYVNTGGSDVWTEAPGWTSGTPRVQDTRVLRQAYTIAATSAALTYAPTNDVSRTWVINGIEFKAAATTGSPAKRSVLLGVGE